VVFEGLLTTFKVSKFEGASGKKNKAKIRINIPS
jgi:hypothetical protein